MQSIKTDDNQAFLYTGNHACWCAGGCGKFRYPVAICGNKFYCENCTSAYQLKPVARPKKKQKRSPYTRKPNLKKRILEQLESGPKNTFELCSALNAHPVCLSSAGRALAKEGLVLSIRERSAVAVSWYALPQHHDQIIDKSKSSLKYAVLTALSQKPMTVLELQALAPEHKPSSISSMLWQLIRAKKIIGAGSSHFRAYGLPKHKELVEQKAQERPIRDKLLHLLKTVDCPLHQREISRRSGIPQRTAILYLDELEREGVVSSYFSENKKYYKLA